MPNWYRLYLDNRRENYVGMRSGVIRKIPQSYPWRWLDIRQAICAFFSSEEKESQEEVQFLWPDGIMPRARQWYARAIEHGFLNRIDPETRAEFRAWLIELDAAAAAIPEESPDETDAERHWRIDLEYAHFEILKPFSEVRPHKTLHWLMHDPEANDLPKEMRMAAGDMLRFERSFSELTAHHVVHEPSPHLLFGPASFQQHDREDVLLLEISSGYGLTTQWADCCWFQIWIDPDDLAARRFDLIRPEIRW